MPSAGLTLLGLIAIAIFVGANISNSGNASSASTTPPSPSSSTPSGGPAGSAAPAHVLWQRHVTFASGGVYSIDSNPPLRNDSQEGFDAGPSLDMPGEFLQTFQLHLSSPIALAPSPVSGAPSRSGCAAALNHSTGTVQIGGAGGTGTSIGQWICARTPAGHIARFRYDGGDANSGFRFLIAVWT